MPFDKEKMAAQMNEGEHVRPAAIMLPMLSIEGNKGVFRRLDVTDDGYAEKPREIGQTFQGVIIGIRMALSEFGKTIQRNSMEYDKSTDRVTIFERRGKGAKGKKVFTGFANGAKAAYPELREQRMLYMLVNHELVKFKVKGGSMGYWFKFLQELSKKKLHTFQVIVKLDPSQERNEDMGKDYYASVFSVVRELTEEEMETRIQPEFDKLHAQFETMRSYQASMPQGGVRSPEGLPSLDQEAPEEVPSIDLEAEEPEAQLPDGF